MFVVPFFTKPGIPSQIQWALEPIYLFLENRGKNLWTIDASMDEILSEWLPQNGFVVKRSWTDSTRLYVEVDVDQMNLNAFYTFEELTRKQEKGTEECWRPFLCLKCKDSAEEHLDTHWFQGLDPILKDVLFQVNK
jgi:hypothetical protein